MLDLCITVFRLPWDQMGLVGPVRVTEEDAIKILRLMGLASHEQLLGLVEEGNAKHLVGETLLCSVEVTHNVEA